jgi:hypothetical protein
MKAAKVTSGSRTIASAGFSKELQARWFEWSTWLYRAPDHELRAFRMPASNDCGQSFIRIVQPWPAPAQTRPIVSLRPENVLGCVIKLDICVSLWLM